MTTLNGKVALVTGAGRGVGRAHALMLARSGARVIVNDYGGSAWGEGTDLGPAEEVAREIKAAGGEAQADTTDISVWADAQRLGAVCIQRIPFSDEF
jgi:NAD(P)-dependent dehydrogenase (short-subunit alcohol dehydrogenase family)